MNGAISRGADGVFLNIHVQPAARCNAVIGLYGDAIKIALTAPPQDGKANLALLGFVIETLKLPKSDIKLVSGLKSRRKRLFIRGNTAALIKLIQSRLLHD
ncbi:MAG: DUF167 domain-containing protein [Mariprofundaceae bacterium]